MSAELTPEKIKDNLSTLLIGSEVRVAGEVGSTNDWAKQELARGAAPGLAVVADSQTEGRGRYGRTWVSPPGLGLYLSVLLAPPVEKNHYPLLTLMAGVAAARAAAAFSRTVLGLKWPNDLLVGTRKLGGILLEYCPGERSGVVLGIGINVNNPSFPDDIENLATSLRLANGAPVDRLALLRSLLNCLDEEYEGFLLGGDREIVRKWSERSPMFGEPVSVVQGPHLWEGTALRLDDWGRLVIRTGDGREQVFDAGEVTLRRAAE
ncbi:MAG: biotin--[acetyl-CoA-carboxylase] ligase [Nitrospinaceae bacterium]|nr:MAG: biotin--[acetyl-CoA-carboxylase] ligase [Nitrospinaceae bacterium]